MKRKTKEVIILLVMIAIILTLSTISNGANTFKAGLTATKTTLKPGEEVTVTLGVSDINMGEDGINTLEGKIKYDTNIFETIKSSSIQNLNNWNTTYNDENSSLNGKFLAVKLNSGDKESTQIFSVKFKVKADVKEVTETKIEFQGITSNDGTELINVGTKSVTIKVDVANTEKPDQGKPGTGENNTAGDNTAKNNTTGNNTNSGNKNQIKNTTIVDKTQSDKTLPKAGKSLVLMTMIATSTIVVIALAIKNKTMKDIK